ncbi:MAG: hypothetical protein IH594_10885 [Bacteroidales bacterium]|nr:hypothetical protein [Bacteroidales bacterium]
MIFKSLVPIVFPLALICCNAQHFAEIDLIKIQELKGFQLDGIDNEWNNVPERRLYAGPEGKFPLEDDLRADFKLAWNGTDLLLLVTVKDDEFTADTLFPWNGDAVELFLTDGHGSDNIVQYSIVTGEPEKDEAFVKIQDNRKFPEPGWKKPFLKNKIRKEENTIHLELQLALDIFGNNQEDKDIYLQLYIDDSDPLAGDIKNQLTWYPIGHSYMNSFATHQIKRTGNENTILPGTSRLVITDRKKIDLHVFGTGQNDRITVYRGQEKLLDTLSNSTGPEIPETYDLSRAGLNTSQDSLYVFLNGKFLSFHNLILAPLKYNETKPQRFEREINLFRLKDRLGMPEPGGALFIGSSSIRLWNSVFMDFPELNVIHRGFGGSISSDVLTYLNDIVLPYKPSVIVYYEGDNDIPHGLPHEQIIANMKEFIERVKKENPETKIYLVSPKPAIVRMHLWEKYKSLHHKMESLASEYQDVFFVDVASAMFNEEGRLMKHIFTEDSLHMNQKGYDIWTKVLRDSMNLGIKYNTNL